MERYIYVIVLNGLNRIFSANSDPKCLIIAVLSTLLMVTYEASQVPSNLDGNEDPREAYFNGSAYLKLASTLSVYRHSGLSFRTCDGGRLFTQRFNVDSISLEVTPEGLVFLAIIGQQRYEAKLNARLLNNAWHYVNLFFRLGNLTLSAAGHTQVRIEFVWKFHLVFKLFTR